MSVGISVKGVKSFDGTNFQGWKAQINALFLMNDVLDVVDGTTEMPEEREDNATARKKFVKDNATARYIMLSSMDETQQVCVLSCTSAKDMWDKLGLIHEQKTTTNKLGLLQKFHAYRMSESDTAIQHVARVVNMASQLSDVGERQSDTTITAKILASLTPKYEMLKIAWDSVEPARQTLEHLQERLIREDTRLNADDEVTSALTAVQKKKGKFKIKKSKKDIKCYKCSDFGHFARECKTKPVQKKDGGNASEEKARDCAFVVETGTSSAAVAQVESTGSQIREIMSADQSEIWLIDSGASRHLTYRREWLVNYRERPRGETIVLGDNDVCDIAGEGTVLIKKLDDGVWIDSRIENVLLVPKLRKNLFSVGSCTKKGLEIVFRGKVVQIMRDDYVLASGIKQTNGVCRMIFKTVKTGSAEEANVAATNLSVWHERFGHVGARAIRELVKKGLVTGVNLTENDTIFCEPCRIGKSHKLPFDRKSGKVSTEPGEVFHTDVCGPMSEDSLAGSKYFLTFKDDASGYRTVYFLKNKSDVLVKFRKFEKEVKNKFGRTMKRLRSDNGREFCNREMSEYLESRGIIHETTAPYTPQQNGKSERDNRTIVESARTMIKAKNLPLYLWAEAVNCAVYVLNRTVWSTNAVTPYEKWIGKSPNLRHLRIFGSIAYENIPKQFTKKFDARSRKVIFVGYKENSPNYRVYNPETKKIRESRDVIFNEKIGTTVPETSSDVDNDELILPWSIENEKEEEEEASGEEGDYEVFEDVEEEVEAPQVENVQGQQRELRDRAAIQRPSRYELDYAEYVIPNNYKEAKESTEATQWAGAIEEELVAHEKNCTWSIVPRTSNMRPIDSKWVFRVKPMDDGQMPRFKARLCARGFLQREGVDFNETFAPVIRYESLRVLLAMITEKDLETRQFDVKTAFLYGQLKEEIYMEIPEGLKTEESAIGAVCKLAKSLYGLKQAPRCWNQRFTRFLREFEFVECEADKCIFVSRFKNDTVYLGLFVDDGLIASKNKETLELILHKLSETFEITIGETNTFVGIQIKRDRIAKSMLIHQSVYTKKIIEKFRMNDAKPLSVPADPHVKLVTYEEGDEKLSNVPYREAIGSLVFLAAVTRPDITFAVNAVSKFTNEHTVDHWKAVKRIFAYLCGTIDLGIEYRSGGSDSRLLGFSDADFAGDLETRRSTTGYVFCLANGAVTWSSKRQKLVTLSTTEAEYVAASTATRELVWLRKLLADIGCPCEDATVLQVDNQSAIKLAKNPIFHKRTKHIDIHYHFIREKLDEKIVEVKYVPSEEQRADILTKAIARDRFKGLREMLSLKTVETN